MGKAATQLIEKFAQRKPNRQRNGEVEYHYARKGGWFSRGEGAQIYCRGNTLFSYGDHWPLAVYLGKRQGKDFFLKNGDRYSHTTNGHLGACQGFCPGPTISLNAIQNAGFFFEQIRLENIVCFQQDSRTYVVKDKKTGRFFLEDYQTNSGCGKPFTPLKQGMFIASRGPGYNDYLRGEWHILGAVVLRNHKNEYFLCSLDEGRYFVTELPGKPQNIKQAFELLQPPAVRKAFRAGLDVLRQGEWFFIPTGLDNSGLAQKHNCSIKSLLKATQIAPLKQPREHQNDHVCRYVEIGGKTYARGKVFHKDPLTNRLTGEHKTLVLGDKTLWYEVHHNAELRSWAMSGNFD